MLPEQADLLQRKRYALGVIVLLGDPDILGIVLWGKFELDGIPAHLPQEVADVFQGGVGKLLLIQNVLHVLGAYVPHGHIMERGAFFVRCHGAVLGTGLLSGCGMRNFIFPLVPGGEHITEKPPAVSRIIGGFVVPCQRNTGRYPVRITAQDIISGIAVGIDPGIYTHLERVLPAAGQLHHGAGTVRAPLAGPSRTPYRQSRLQQGQAAMGAYICFAADLAGALRALCERHVVASSLKNGYKKYSLRNYRLRGCPGDGTMSL